MDRGTMNGLPLPRWPVAAVLGTAICASTAGTAKAQHREHQAARALRSIQNREPSIDRVRRDALQYAGLHQRLEAGWARRSRMAGLLPQLSIRTTRGRGSDSDLSRSSSGSERLAHGTDADVSLEIRAVWELDRLVFDPAEIRAATLAERLHRARSVLLAQVNSTYYRRRRAQIELVYLQSSSPSERAVVAVEIEELTAQLDALTGGRFSTPGLPKR